VWASDVCESVEETGGKQSREKGKTRQDDQTLLSLGPPISASGEVVSPGKRKNHVRSQRKSASRLMTSLGLLFPLVKKLHTCMEKPESHYNHHISPKSYLQGIFLE
jgi:hypothetical protein